jgi:hypothetical protein
MSLGLRLLANLSSPASDTGVFLTQIAEWIHKECAEVLPTTRQDFVESSPTLFCKLHPAAAEVEFSLIDSEQLVVSANTSSVGPGYHIFLCAALAQWARDFQASWSKPEQDSEEYSDETEYFFTQDAQKVFDHMTAWLRALAGTFFGNESDPEVRGAALCMPMNAPFISDEQALTPLGPRDLGWLQKTSQDGTDGRDFFAWWMPGLNAEYFLGRALTRMWSDVRWRIPVNDAEREVLEEVADSLHRAHQLGPALQFPWTEWAEILRFLGIESPETDFVRSRAGGEPTVGYRRGVVRATLPGFWTMRIPGSFSEFEADEGNDFFALDPPREIWFTAYQFDSADDEVFASRRREIRESQPELLEETEEYISKAAIRQKTTEKGDQYFVLSSSTLCVTGRAVCSILFSRPEQRESVVEMWRSIRPR